MELASIFFGFIIAYFAYTQSGLSSRLGCAGWLTVFWGFWICGALLAFFIILITGFLAKWIFIGFIVLLLISFFRRK
ncbi:hypothetical protein [Aquibacillus kalidii]|uniref:hypothetical protein n=1 Tax=Aquibacillus kalidii TaxID=2762597 RepID=UPI00164886FD|nr:hypothetical protein [Aquibacillus kalidii]